MKKFVPLNDLSSLTDEQLQEYVTSVCNHFEVPVELNLLYPDWFDTGDGARKKVLYASKGFADFMRGKLGIETDTLDETISDGTVRYKCKGHDKHGRHEIAIGARAIAGLTGKKLEFAFAGAQTSATRRMTLQFVGAGVLDESEKPVNSMSVDISAARLPLAQLPTVEVNTVKGKLVQLVDQATNQTVDLVNQQHPFAGEAVTIAHQLGKVVNESLYPDNSSGSLFPETKTEVISGELRRRPGPQRVSEPLITANGEGSTVDTGKALDSPLAEISFKAWLIQLTNKTLPLPPSGESSTFMTYGGMKPSIGIGGISMKVRLFARNIFPGKELDKLTAEEQNEFRLLFENKLKEVGSVGLVKYINDSLGVKEA